MADIELLLILLICNIGIAFAYFRWIHPADGWVSPLGIVLLIYLCHYPIRATMLFIAQGTSLEWELKSWQYSFERHEIVMALAYATLFMGILVGFYARLCHARMGWLSHKKYITATGLTTSWRSSIFLAMFAAFVLVFIYKAITGELFGLYNELADIKRPFLVNVILMVIAWKWFLLAYGFLRWQKNKSLPVLVLTATLTFIIIISAVISTGKGDLMTMALLWAGCVWLVRGKIPKYTVTAAAAAVIVFSFYSYAARLYGTTTVSDMSTIETVRENIWVTNEFYEQEKGVWREQAGKIFSRFKNTDGLIMCRRKNPLFGSGLYVVGSLVEFANVVPRPIWPTRPHISFNHHLSQAVWDRDYASLVEMPIGRIGESFYVMNWAGLLYAVFYAFFWNWLYVRFMMRARTDEQVAFYLCLICLIVMPDAHLIYNWKLVLVATVGYWLLSSDAGIETKKIAAALKRPDPTLKNLRTLPQGHQLTIRTDAD